MGFPWQVDSIVSQTELCAEPPEHLADLWLESVARGTMHVFGEEMLKIPELTPHGAKQLITDIGEWLELFNNAGRRGLWGKKWFLLEMTETFPRSNLQIVILWPKIWSLDELQRWKIYSLGGKPRCVTFVFIIEGLGLPVTWSASSSKHVRNIPYKKPEQWPLCWLTN